jgi:ribosomal protein L37AE/L43A
VKGEANMILPKRCPECKGSCYTSDTILWECKDCHNVYILQVGIDNPKGAFHKTNKKSFINFD